MSKQTITQQHDYEGIKIQQHGNQGAIKEILDGQTKRLDYMCSRYAHVGVAHLVVTLPDDTSIPQDNKLIGDSIRAMRKTMQNSGMIKDRMDEAKRSFDDLIEQLDALCEGVKPPKQDLEYIHYFCGESGTDLVTDEILSQSREKLYRLVGALIRAYAEIKPDMTSAGYSDEEQRILGEKVKFYTNLRETIGRASGDFIDLKVYEPGMRYLIDNYILAEDSKPLGKFDDFTLLDFILIKSKEMTDEKNDEKTKAGAAEVIENNIRKKIVERLLVNPKYYEKMSAILEQLIEERRKGTSSYKALLDKYCKLAKNAATPENNLAYPESIRRNGALRALYDNTGEDEELALRLNAAVLRGRQDRFRNNPVKERRIKRELYKELHNEDEVERIFKIIVEQAEY